MTSTATHGLPIGQDSRQASYEASSPEPLLIRAEGKSGCRHSSHLVVSWDTAFCGLCFLQDGFSDESPAKLHYVRTLADNGNPQQTERFEEYTALMEGIYHPLTTQTTQQFRRARKYAESEALPNTYPFTTAVWQVMGNQPPLGLPLSKAVRGIPERVIAQKMDVSLVNVNIRLFKGVRMAAKLVRGYSDDKRRKEVGSDAGHTSDQTKDPRG